MSQQPVPFQAETSGIAIPEEIATAVTTLYDGPEGQILIPQTQGAYAYFAQNTAWKTVKEKLARYFTHALMTTPTILFIPHTAPAVSIAVKAAPKSDSAVGTALFRFRDYFNLAAKERKDVRPKYRLTASGLYNTYDEACDSLPDELTSLLDAVTDKKVRRTIFMGMPLDFVPENGRSAAILLYAAQLQCDNQSAYEDVLREIPAALWSRPFFCEQLIKTSFWAFDSMPDSSKTESLCLRAANDTGDLDEFGTVLRNIPQAIWEKPLFGDQIVAMDWHGFGYIPGHCKTPAICLKAAEDTTDFDEFMEVVNDIPPDIWNDESFCLSILDQDIRAFENIPDQHKTASICMKAVEATDDTDELDTVVSNIPDHVWQDPDFSRRVVEHDWHSFANVPDSYKTADVCLIAAKGTEDIDEFNEVSENVPRALWSDSAFAVAMICEDWHALSHIPTGSKNTVMCLAALRATPDEDEFIEALDEVPDMLYANTEFAAAVVAMNWKVIENIPNRYIDANVCLSAAKATTTVDDFVSVIDNSPSALWDDPEFCLAMVDDCWKACDYVPDKNKSAELCLKAADGTEDRDDFIEVLDSVPSAIWADPEFCLGVVKQSWRALEYVPDATLTPAIIVAAAQKTKKLERFLEVADRAPEVYWGDPAFCRAMVEDSHHALTYVPVHNRTKELCILALVPDTTNELGHLVPASYWNDRNFCVSAGFTDPGPRSGNNPGPS